jgi:site-specific recombinase XerD
MKQRPAQGMLYGFLVVRQLVPTNPTTSVRGPKYVVKRGKTPVWSREDTKKLLESIPRDDLAGLRDRALICTMLFSFARVSAVLSLKRQDLYYQGPKRWLRFHEKGGKEQERPAHPEIERAILARVSIGEQSTAVSEHEQGWHSLERARAEPAQCLGSSPQTSPERGVSDAGRMPHLARNRCTVYLENGGRLEHAQYMAAHESPRTTKLYDRTKDEITINEVERIQL